MCGIVGFVGNTFASKKLFYGLERLEYRGYDSAGVALQDGSGKIEILRSSGRLELLKNKFASKEIKDQLCGIGHTRWATHGAANETNAHPHFSDDKSVAIVHNGILENHKELKEKLIKNGYSFYSETDTEVLAKLIHYYLIKYKKPMDALARVCLRATGSYAVCVLFECSPNEIYCIKNDSPMVVCKTKDGVMVASDTNAIEGTCKYVAYVENHEIVRLSKNGYEFFTIDQEPIHKQTKKIIMQANLSEKLGYAHFMLKEINEQPQIVKRLVGYYSKNGAIKNIDINTTLIQKAKCVNIIACGSAYNAGLVGARTIEKLTKIPTHVDLASEWRYKSKAATKNDLMIFVSQSGETADTLSCLRQAKHNKQKTIAIVNVGGSSIARECDVFLPLLAGSEIAVATTKAYLAQVVVFHFLALKMAKTKGLIGFSKQKSCIFKISKLCGVIKKCLSDCEKIQQIAHKVFEFALIWSFGSVLIEDNRLLFDRFFKDCLVGIKRYSCSGSLLLGI